jgi:hypothetical protein
VALWLPPAPDDRSEETPGVELRRGELGSGASILLVGNEVDRVIVSGGDK